MSRKPQRQPATLKKIVKLWSAIDDFQRENKYSPSFVEITAMLDDDGYNKFSKSTSVIMTYFDMMEEFGMLSRSKMIARAIALHPVEEWSAEVALFYEHKTP